MRMTQSPIVLRCMRTGNAAALGGCAAARSMGRRNLTLIESSTPGIGFELLSESPVQVLPC